MASENWRARYLQTHKLEFAGRAVAKAYVNRKPIPDWALQAFARDQLCKLCPSPGRYQSDGLALHHMAGLVMSGNTVRGAAVRALYESAAANGNDAEKAASERTNIERLCRLYAAHGKDFEERYEKVEDRRFEVALACLANAMRRRGLTA